MCAFREKSVETQLVDAVRRNRHQQVKDEMKHLASAVRGGSTSRNISPSLRSSPRLRNNDYCAPVISPPAGLPMFNLRSLLGSSASTPQLPSPHAATHSHSSSPEKASSFAHLHVYTPSPERASPFAQPVTLAPPQTHSSNCPSSRASSKLKSIVLQPAEELFGKLSSDASDSRCSITALATQLEATTKERELALREAVQAADRAQELRQSVAGLTAQLDAMTKERDSALSQPSQAVGTAQLEVIMALNQRIIVGEQQCVQSKREGDELRDSVARLKIDLEAMTNQRDSLLARKAQDEDQITVLRGSVAATATQLEIATKERDVVDTQRKESNELQSTVAALTSQLDALTKERDFHRSSVTLLTSRLQETTEGAFVELTAERRVSADLKHELMELRLEHDLSEGRVVEVTEKLHALEDWTQQSVEVLASQFESSLAEWKAKWAVSVATCKALAQFAGWPCDNLQGEIQDGAEPGPLQAREEKVLVVSADQKDSIEDALLKFEESNGIDLDEGWDFLLYDKNGQLLDMNDEPDIGRFPLKFVFEQTAAIVKIQSIIRGWNARREFKRHFRKAFPGHTEFPGHTQAKDKSKAKEAKDKSKATEAAARPIEDQRNSPLILERGYDELQAVEKCNYPCSCSEGEEGKVLTVSSMQKDKVLMVSAEQKDCMEDLLLKFEESNGMDLDEGWDYLVYDRDGHLLGQDQEPEISQFPIKFVFVMKDDLETMCSENGDGCTPIPG